MPTSKWERTEPIIPGHATCYRGILVRVAETTMHGHILEFRPAPERVQKREARKQAGTKRDNPV